MGNTELQEETSTLAIVLLEEFEEMSKN